VAEGDGEEQGAGTHAGTPDVFISHASQDAAVADAVVAALERHGLNCWIAPRDVVPCSLYADGIVRAINAAKICVLVLSAHSVESPHVGKEIERACAKRRPIIALRTDTAALTPAFEYFLSESQWIDLAPGGTAAATVKLVEAIRRHLSPGAAAESHVHAGTLADRALTTSRQHEARRCPYVIRCRRACKESAPGSRGVGFQHGAERGTLCSVRGEAQEAAAEPGVLRRRSGCEGSSSRADTRSGVRSH
jgi:TIR domain